MNNFISRNSLTMQEYYVVQKTNENGIQYINEDGYAYDKFITARKFDTVEEAIKCFNNNSATTILKCYVMVEIVHQAEIDYQLKKSALSKLTSEEIRALGLG